MNERRGGWMSTFTGRRVYPLDLRPEDIDIVDIAHALSMICRFGGHCGAFYSVAQHSVHVAEQCPFELRTAALLHDAAEAYLGDIIQPLKRELYLPRITGNNPGWPIVQPQAYREVERWAHRTILTALTEYQHGLGVETERTIHHADWVMLATERRDLMQDTDGEWACLDGISPATWRIMPWTPNVAKARFLERFNLRTEVEPRG